jgi:hypothetical protein
VGEKPVAGHLAAATDLRAETALLTIGGVAIAFSAQAKQAAAHPSITPRMRRMSGALCRIATRLVSSQASAQSRATRITRINL